MKNNKPVALILFGVAMLLFAWSYAVPETQLFMIGIVAAIIGLALFLTGLLLDIKQK